ncbi:ubiquinone/menaquinone biosynthesis methyltransferase [Campylobacter sputorum subsp. bubulus]|uniref:Ubiquinone/menaquinone biosynthesis methyltransferase n=2 Tax=Campylobacter sputorum TaxID=206 RepID=A0A381DJS3_9BACT|nr:glycosyltransferase [Campylobacter sputorum]SUX09096.1 ubiquinone/menaquinone biosynthesis methyltransferase [Campylobacter sputorum subsp. bubulus]SUX10787.1 ubiquinone/menaquinone biosynthesis methyltransferase [Campylobacter sputorum subsp. sputorum]
MDNFYKNFEDAFRGSKESIKIRLNVYIKFLNILKYNNETIKVLDIACGRGEWLELLKENSIDAMGCDIDQGMIDVCLKNELNVKKIDALNFLRTCKDNSIDAITGFHVIEHLDFEYLNMLIKESFRVLKENGILIFETPNPENLRVSTLYFYTDITHKKPIPPELLSHIVDYNSFNKKFIIRRNSKLDKNSYINIENIINDVSPDYALVALKLPSNNILSDIEMLAYDANDLSFDDLVNKFNNQNLQTKKEQLENINDIKKQLEIINEFITKFKRVFSPLIKIYHIFVRIKLYIEKIFSKFIFYIVNFINNRPKIKKMIKLVIKKYPYLYTFASKICSNQKSYRKFNTKNIPQILDIKFSNDHVLNLQLKEYEKYFKNFDDLTIIGHINGSYGLSSTNRNIALQYIEVDKNLHFIPYEDSKFSDIENLMISLNDEKKIKDILLYEKPNFKNSINIYQHYPPIEDVEKGYNIIIFFWEESKIPAKFIDIINTHYNAVIVSTYFIKKVLIDNGCLLPIKVSDLPLQKPLCPTVVKNSSIKKEIILLHISSCFPRKGVDILLKSFNKISQNINFNFKLTIKTFHNIHNDILNLVETLVDKKFHENIKIIFDDYSSEQIANLYEQCDIVVLPTRGEGLNMPAVEACYYKKPLIVTKYGAQSDFLYNKATFIDFSFQQTNTHFNINNSTWSDPLYEDLADKIINLAKKIIDDDSVLREDLNELNLRILKTMFSTKTTQNFISSLSSLYAFRSKNPIIKIAIISSYNDECGISEYSTYIVNELKNLDIDYEIYSWSQKQSNTIKIQKDNPLDIKTNCNIIWLQHHFGFYSLDDKLLKNLIEHKKKRKILAITLHSTEPILNFDTENQIKAIEVLSNFDRIFVHTINDLNVLRALSLVDNVTLIPHGIQKIQRKNKKNKLFNIGFFGLLFEHKNLDSLIEAFGEFSKQNDSILNIISHPRDETSRYLFERYKDKINKLNLKQKIIWHSEFLPINKVNEILSNCDLIVLPYLDSDESASGALRIALSCCDNVMITKSRIFDDMRYLCIEIDGFKSADILKGLNDFMKYKTTNKKELIDKFIDENSWKNIVLEQINIFKSLLIDNSFIDFLLNNNKKA